MSYSISSKAATKSLLLAALASQMAQVVASQPTHATDQAQALSAAETFLGLMPEAAPEGQAFAMSISGSISTVEDALVSVALNVYTSFAAADPVAEPAAA